MEKEYVVSSRVEREKKREVYSKMRLLSKIVHGMSEKLMCSELSGLGFELGFDPCNCYIIATGLTSKALAYCPDGNFNYYEIAPLMNAGADRIVRRHGFQMAHFFDTSTDVWNIIVSPNDALAGDDAAAALAHDIQDCVESLCREAVLKSTELYCVVTSISDRIRGYDGIKAGFEQACRLRRLDFFSMQPAVIDRSWYDAMYRPAGRMEINEVLHSLEVSVLDGRPEAIPCLMKALTAHLMGSLDLQMVDDIGSVLGHYLLSYGYLSCSSLPGHEDGRLNSDSYPTLAALMTEAEARLVRCAQEVNRESVHICSVTRSAVRYIQAHFRENLAQQEIAQAIGVVPQYLSSVFNRDMGIGVPAYINHLRIREAQALLRNTDMKISEIARSIGMTNAESFCAMFKRITGMSATAFRAQCDHPIP